MQKRISFTFLAVPLLYACAGQQSAPPQPYVYDTGKDFAQWVRENNAQRFTPPDSLESFRMTHRGDRVSVARREFPTHSSGTSKFPQGEKPEFWQVTSDPGMVFFELGNRVVGVRWAEVDSGRAGQLAELPEGTLNRIHVDVSQGQRVVIAYYDDVASEAALGAETVSCTRCPPSRVCSVDPYCQ